MQTQGNTTILYVDDEPINLFLFKKVLSRNNYQVLTATSGAEALDILDDNGYIPVVVTDMRMPGMDGVEFVTKAKKNHPRSVFFILTSFDLTPEIATAIEDKRVMKYIRKPFDQHQMNDYIKEALSVIGQ